MQLLFFWGDSRSKMFSFYLLLILEFSVMFLMYHLFHPETMLIKGMLLRIWIWFFCALMRLLIMGIVIIPTFVFFWSFLLYNLQCPIYIFTKQNYGSYFIWPLISLVALSISSILECVLVSSRFSYNLC